MLLNVTEYHPEWGKPILESQHNQFGDAEQQTLSEYNDTGFLVREVLREPDGEILEEKTFEPDDQQRVKKEFRHYLDGTFDVLEFFYDEKGHVVRKILSDDEGEVETEEVFEYRNGLLMKETLLESGKEPIKETVYIYDNDDFLDSKQVNDLASDQVIRQEYSYNEAGHRDAVLTYDGSGELIERILLNLDEKGRPVGIEEENRQKKNKTVLTYDERDNIIFQEETDIYGDIVSKVVRAYDKNGWLLQSEVEVRNPVLAANQHYEVYHEYEFYDG